MIQFVASLLGYEPKILAVRQQELHLAFMRAASENEARLERELEDARREVRAIRSDLISDVGQRQQLIGAVRRMRDYLLSAKRGAHLVAEANRLIGPRAVSDGGNHEEESPG